MKLHLIIPGTPIAWKRPAQSGHKRFDSQALIKKQLALLIRPQLTQQKWRESQEPLALYVNFNFKPNKSIYKTITGGKRVHCLKHIDCDNMLKFYLDLFQDVGVYKDDSQIIHICATKVYNPLDEKSVFCIEEL